MASRERVPKYGEIHEAEIMLGLLEAVEADGERSQRGFAIELGIALGLVNTYLSRCIKKGWVKVRQVPARRFVYYITPRGFVEKSNLTAQYLSSSFGFFREAKADCLALLMSARAKGQCRLVLAGKSDLAEIALLCAASSGVDVVAVVDPSGGWLLSRPVTRSFTALSVDFDVIIITDLINSALTRDSAINFAGREKVLVPGLLRLGGRSGSAASEHAT